MTNLGSDVDSKAKQLALQAEQAHGRAVNVVCRTPREYKSIAEDLKAVKEQFKQVEGHRTHLKEPFLEGGRRIDEFFRAPLQWLKEAEQKLKSALLGYEREQERIASEKQRQLDEEARKQREKLEADARAERERVDREYAELKRKAEAARAKGQEAKANQLTGQAAASLRESEERASAMIDEAANIVAPIVMPEIPVIQGQSTKAVWKHRVVNISLVPREYLMVNDTLLATVARATKGPSMIPGVEFYTDYSKSSTSR